MIEINLLPEELREIDHTPYPRLVAILVGLVAFLGLFYFAFAEYQQIGFLNQEIKGLKELNAKDKNKVDQVEALKKSLANNQKREELVLQIVRSKMVWARKLDQFNEMVSNYKDLWFDGVTIDAKTRAYTVTNTMKTKGHLMLEPGADAISEIGKLENFLTNPNNDFCINIDMEKFEIRNYTFEENDEISKKIANFDLNIQFIDRNIKKKVKKKKVKP